MALWRAKVSPESQPRLGVRAPSAEAVKPTRRWPSVDVRWALAFVTLALLSGCFKEPDRPGSTGSSGTSTLATVLALEPVATGFDQPIFLTDANDGTDRLFVVERAGRILILENGTVRPEPFLDIGEIVDSESYIEMGLLGLAFDPKYNETGRAYVHYTNLNGDIVLARYMVDASNSERLDRDSGEVLLTIPHLVNDNHNGGMLAFGPDGFLYSGIGDGGLRNDPDRDAQNLFSLLGKILRLDVSGETGYESPPSNPFNDGSGSPEIWAYGVRNPWRFSFDRATGDVLIGDVGQDAWEEVDWQAADSAGGENYGWNGWEGNVRSLGVAEGDVVFPIHVYPLDGSNQAVVGGYVYRGTLIPDLVGKYVFADYTGGAIWTLERVGEVWTALDLAAVGFAISSFGEDQHGELYVVDFSGGRILKFLLRPEA